MNNTRYAEPHEYPDDHFIMTVNHLGVHTYISMGDIRKKSAKKERASLNSCIYAISDGVHIKIGKSNDPDKRLYSLQTSNSKVLSIVATLDCESQTEAFKLEKQLHSKFSEFRLKGEWFNISIETLQAEWLTLTKENK